MIMNKYINKKDMLPQARVQDKKQASLFVSKYLLAQKISWSELKLNSADFYAIAILKFWRVSKPE